MDMLCLIQTTLWSYTIDLCEVQSQIQIAKHFLVINELAAENMHNRIKWYNFKWSKLANLIINTMESINSNN